MLFKTFQDLQIPCHRELLLVCLINYSDVPRGSLLVDWWIRFLQSESRLIGKVLLAPNHSCLWIFLEVRGPVLFLPPLILIFPRRPNMFQTCIPSRQSPVPTAQHCGCPLLPLVGGLWSLERRRRGAKGGMDRGCQKVIVTGHISGDCAITGEERENIVLCVCGSFGHRSWRELCVRLDVGLAVLELNQGLNFILNQLGEKSHHSFTG